MRPTKLFLGSLLLAASGCLLPSYSRLDAEPAGSSGAAGSAGAKAGGGGQAGSSSGGAGAGGITAGQGGGGATQAGASGAGQGGKSGEGQSGASGAGQGGKSGGGQSGASGAGQAGSAGGGAGQAGASGAGASGASGASGVAGTAGVGGASGGTAGAGGSSGAGGAGDCDPYAQTGCPADKAKCGWVSNDVGCSVAGAQPVGSSCAPVVGGGDSCVPGSACYGSPAQCRKFCHPGSGTTECSAGQDCSLVAQFPSGKSTGICAPNGKECDPVAQDCFFSFGCYPLAGGTMCLQAGTKAPGDACSSTTDCQKGAVCGSTDMHPSIMCRKLCDASATQCEPGQGCYLIPALGYGLCVPP